MNNELLIYYHKVPNGVLVTVGGWMVQVDKETAEFEQDFLRSLETRRDKGMSLVHWWYYPDSYDEWIPNNEVEGEADDAQVSFEDG